MGGSWRGESWWWVEDGSSGAAPRPAPPRPALQHLASPRRASGAWTGAIIASLLEMPLEAAMGSILAGVVLAGLIMTTLTLAGKVRPSENSHGRGEEVKR